MDATRPLTTDALVRARVVGAPLPVVTGCGIDRVLTGLAVLVLTMLAGFVVCVARGLGLRGSAPLSSMVGFSRLRGEAATTLLVLLWPSDRMRVGVFSSPPELGGSARGAVG